MGIYQPLGSAKVIEALSAMAPIPPAPERSWRKVAKPVVTRCVYCGHRHITHTLWKPCRACLEDMVLISKGQ